MSIASMFGAKPAARDEDSNMGVGASSSTTQERRARLEKATPWVEKYRPKKVTDVVHQEEVVRTLQKSLETGNLPHFLFYGPPGTGKTSSALAIVRQLFGPDLMKQRVCELNASDERGIGIVRGKIKTFSEGAVSRERPVNYPYPCPPFKVVILDEADAMTADAQAALRRTMETTSGVTRFFLICNYVSRIIEPLASRCAKFRFRLLGDELQTGQLRRICTAENIEMSDAVLDTIAEVAHGDMRKAITFLQSVNLLYGGGSAEPQHVLDIAGAIPGSTVDELLTVCKSSDMDRVEAHIKSVVRNGYPAVQLLTQFLRRVIADASLAEQKKAKIAIRIAEADQALLDGADEFLQMLDVTTFTTNILVS